jgi:Lrp/AsnC family transcriptional regulator, regulator for asnA, asnC and gidA
LLVLKQFFFIFFIIEKNLYSICDYLQTLVQRPPRTSVYLHRTITMKDAPAEQSLDNLDELDIQLLSYLQEDGRKSFTDIATETGLAVSTVCNRLTNLMESKVIQIIGRVEPERVGFHVYARIGVAVRPVAETNAVGAHIAKLKEVSFLALTSREYSLEVNVMCRDNNHLTDLLTKIHAIKGVSTTSFDAYLKVLETTRSEFAFRNLHSVQCRDNKRTITVSSLF